MAITQTYGPLFGLREPQKELRVMKQESRADNGTKVRYQQIYQGVPVIGGEIIINMDSRRSLMSMNGEVSSDLSLSITPSITTSAARTTAVSAMAKWYKAPTAVFGVSEPVLSIYDPKLISPRTTPPQLVWRMEVHTSQPPVRELVLVDAVSGGIVLHFNQIDTIKNRTTYDAENIFSNHLPGGTKTTPVCTEADGDACTNGARPDADLAHLYAGNTYDFYFTHHNRDSLDNAGMTLISTVRFCPIGYTCPYANAFWDGSQMAYGAGYAQADDVVGHELTHGVTEMTSNLFYWYQSGAINESFSDLWGEFIDLTNTGGNDAPGVRWLMGEDIPGLGAIRNMADPPAKGDPDKMTSPNYYFAPYGEDGGGVHHNSGINNKAVYLMTDGGSFNGYTVTGLGITKVAAIYYEVQTNLLTSGSDYNDLYYALHQACQNLIGGPAGVTPSDCLSVINATNAVEMNLQPNVNYNPDAALCPAGKVPAYLYSDDFEGSLFSKWISQSLTGGNAWGQVDSTNGGPYSTSGTKSAFINDISSISDTALQMNSDVALPAGAYLHFRHSYLLEYTTTPVFYDGGVLEYSTNGGVNWSDAGSLFDAGKGYDGTLSKGSGNPLGGRPAFVATSNGFVSSRYNLNSLAGSNVRFRFRLGTDSNVIGNYSNWAWVLDDVGIYTCVNKPVANDFNGDHMSDILWRQASTGMVVQWQMNGFSTSNAAIIGGDSDWSIVKTGDFNGDGKVDILWRQASTGLIVQWLMNGSAPTAGAIIGGGSDWSVVRIDDFNGDGNADILWRQASTGLILMWQMNGSAVINTALIGGDMDWSIVATGDFNGDGKADILWKQASTGLVVEWLMNNTAPIASAIIGGGGDWEIIQTGDLNGDGKSDIIWHHPGGSNIVWYMNGTSVANSADLGTYPDWSIVKTGDYNGDGKADLLWRYNPTGAIVMSLMSGATTLAETTIGGDSDWAIVQ